MKVRVASAAFRLISGMLCALAISTFAQDATVWVPVTFYDFHSDRSNPEFECPHMSGLHLNMVANTLDADRKPRLGSNPHINYYIEAWFRNWNIPGHKGSKGDKTRPVYTYSGTEEWSSNPIGMNIQTMTHDTSFKNMVIPDSLLFRQVPGRPGEYEYSNQNFFYIDNRGFRNEGKAHNFSFTMELHWKFTYEPGKYFEFTGDDDVWVFINNQLVMDLGGIHVPLTSGFTLDAAMATRLGLVVGRDYDLDFFYAERHTDGSNIKITTNIIQSQPQELALSVNNATIKAGDTIDIKGYIKDQKDSLMIDMLQLISWRILPNTQKPGDKIVSVTVPSQNPASVAKFTGTEAFHTATIEARFIDPKDPTNILTALANITIIAGDPFQVFIERESETPLTANALTTQFDSTVAAQPLDLITMNEEQTTRYAYGIIRDMFGNYVGLADNAQWTSRNTSIFTATGTSGKQFECFISRASSGSALLVAQQSSLLPDSVSIEIKNARITDLRLINTATGDTLNALTMTTDDQMKVKVIGIWSDNPGVWTDVTGTWDITDSLRSANAIPTGSAGSWTYSPINPGTGTLKVSSDGKEVSIPVTITPADPSKMFLTILTPENQLIAGQPIKIQVRIENNDGLVPGTWSGDNKFNDSLPNKVSRNPFVVIDGDTFQLNVKGNETFTNGLDTVTVVLYYAPYKWQDSLHQIYGLLDGKGTVYAATEKFHLLPGSLNRLVLEDNNGRAHPDKVTLTYPDDDITLVAMGYDAFGNKIGTQQSKWTRSGTLHPIVGDSVQQIYYTSADVRSDEAGVIKAQALKNLDIFDEIQIEIIGPNAQLVKAITRDRDGDGLLDAIELQFDRKVAFPENFSLSSIHISYYDPSTTRGVTVDFIPSSISPTKGTVDSVFILSFAENTDVQDQPQTNWLPEITIPDFEDADGVNNFLTTDGAGPVIWHVWKYTSNTGDRTNDKIAIKFSEPVTDESDAPSISVSIRPGDLFDVWVLDTLNNRYISADDILERKTSGDKTLDITEFTFTSRDSVEFKMTNGEIIYGNHYFSINTSPNRIHDISDLENKPDANNPKVRVIVKGAMGDLTIGPNPLSPTMRHFEEVLTSHDPIIAHRWAKDDGGAVISLDITMPSANDIQRTLGSINAWKIKGWLMIFDAVGNLVYTKKNNVDMIPDTWRKNWLGGETRSMSMYWNGITDKNMKAAPGLYQAVVFINSNMHGPRKATATMGVGR